MYRCLLPQYQLNKKKKVIIDYHTSSQTNNLPTSLCRCPSPHHMKSALQTHIQYFVDKFSLICKPSCSFLPKPHDKFHLQDWEIHYAFSILQSIILSAKYLGRCNFNHLIMNQNECIVFAICYELQVDVLYTLFEKEIHSQLILKEQYTSCVEQLGIV